MLIYLVHSILSILLWCHISAVWNFFLTREEISSIYCHIRGESEIDSKKNWFTIDINYLHSIYASQRHFNGGWNANMTAYKNNTIIDLFRSWKDRWIYHGRNIHINIVLETCWREFFLETNKRILKWYATSVFSLWLWMLTDEEKSWINRKYDAENTMNRMQTVTNF